MCYFSFLLFLYILQLEASKHQLVFIKFRIGFIILGDIKSVTAYKAHLIKILISRELSFADDVQILIEDDDGEFTSFWGAERDSFCLNS